MRPLWDGRPDVWDGTGKGSIGKQARSPMGCEGRASKLVGRRWWRTGGGACWGVWRRARGYEGLCNAFRRPCCL